jgi:hypothetical protein
MMTIMKNFGKKKRGTKQKNHVVSERPKIRLS